MRAEASRIPAILNVLESMYGNQSPCWPTDPYDFLVWWHCGYPASDLTCVRGWESLNKEVGIEPHHILQASMAKLARALKPGGMVPELRAQRLLEIAARVQDEFAGDLRAGLRGAIKEVRRILKKFPGINDPGADRILLFAGLVPVVAIPSNCPHVIVRIQRGQERENYGVIYREAQAEIEQGVPAKFDARMRAYLLLKQHGQTLCKRTNPKCDQCPVNASCAFFAKKYHGRSTSI